MPGPAGLPTAGTLQRELQNHFEAVQDLYDRVVRSQRRPISRRLYSNRRGTGNGRRSASRARRDSRPPDPSPLLNQVLAARPRFAESAVARTAPFRQR